MAVKHKVTINVSDANGRKSTVLQGCRYEAPGKNRQISVWRFHSCIPLETGTDR
jgi:hypothetical protein